MTARHAPPMNRAILKEIQRGDADQRFVQSEGEPLHRGKGDPQAGEGSRTAACAEEVQFGKFDGMIGAHQKQPIQQLFAVGVVPDHRGCLIPRELILFIFAEKEVGRFCRGVATENNHSVLPSIRISREPSSARVIVTEIVPSGRSSWIFSLHSINVIPSP